MCTIKLLRPFKLRNYGATSFLLSFVLLFPTLLIVAQSVAAATLDFKHHFRGPGNLKTGDLYALVVGLSKYKDPRVPKLDLSDQDAKAFGDFLKTQNEIFGETRVTYLLNEKATKLEIEKYLYYTLPKAGKDDTIILFFSGHGAFDPIRPTEFLFLPYDTEIEYLGTTSVKMSGLEFLKGVNAERVLIIADACYAGGFSQMKPKSVVPPMELFLQEVRNSSGRVVMTSAKPEQLSWEAPNSKNSIFTKNLLEGLKGKADRDRDGIVTLNEAYEYAYSKTKEETSGHQHPQFEGKVVGAFPLSFVGPRLSPAEMKKRIFKAAESGNLSIFEQFVGRVDVDSRNDANDTPLIIASRNGHVQVVKMLLSAGADPDASNHSRATALSNASENGHLDVIKLLLDAGANIHTKNADGMTPLALAAANGHTKAVELLLLRGADLKARTEKGDTALSLAAAGGHLETVKLLVRWSADFRAEEVNANGAILQAARHGHGDVVKTLLVKTRGIKLKSERLLEHQLFLGILRGDAKNVAEAVQAGADLSCEAESGDTALTLAAALGYKDLVKFLLNREGPIMKIDPSALMFAARNGHTEIISSLLAAGLNVNSVDKDGATALMMCSERGHVEAARQLLFGGANVNASAKNGTTALMKAAENGNTEILRLLISYEADVNATDREGNTALMLASAKGHLDAVKILCAKDIKINAKNNQQRTALMAAVRNGHTAIIKYLLTKGSDVLAEDWEGKTALMLATERDRPDIVQLLKSRITN